MSNFIKIGFWYNKNDVTTFEFPEPITDSATDEQVEKSILILRHHIIPKAFERHYKSLSICPVCGCFNHVSFYEYTDKSIKGVIKRYLIPKGLEHIILKHKVLVPELLELNFT